MKQFLLSLVFLLPVSSYIFTQETEEENEDEVEEIVVTGIKSSLVDAIEIKRNNIGVTEIITAEDVGKFPDGNIAEDLARVSGIAIDRSNIEGKEVTVRGMGAQYNMVTLNGRVMPVAPGNYDGGRAYDFGAISSHGIARVEVYKSQNPSLPSGGLGATINMVTAKPLEVDNGGALSFLLMSADIEELVTYSASTRKIGFTVCWDENMKVNIITARIKLARGPANITAALCHFGFVSNKLSNCSSVKFFFISGSASRAFFDK